jgi:hypothetical protein
MFRRRQLLTVRDAKHTKPRILFHRKRDRELELLRRVALLERNSAKEQTVVAKLQPFDRELRFRHGAPSERFLIRIRRVDRLLELGPLAFERNPFESRDLLRLVRANLSVDLVRRIDLFGEIIGRLRKPTIGLAPLCGCNPPFPRSLLF